MARIRTLWSDSHRNAKLFSRLRCTSLRNRKDYLNRGNLLNMSAPLLYKNLESILNVLAKPEHKDLSVVQELIEIYTKANDKKEKFYAAGEIRNHPLIILEGLDGSGKSTAGSKFAKKINGVKWQTPPKSISHLRVSLDDNKSLRTAFYSLGNYIAALEVEVLLREHPVIMDRYWHSTAAFAIAQAVHDQSGEYEMPTEGDPIYEWPDDLFKPDIVLLLNVREDIRQKRLSSRTDFTAQETLLKTSLEFRNNVIQAYKNMRNPDVTFVNGNLYFKKLMEELQVHVNPVLKINK